MSKRTELDIRRLASKDKRSSASHATRILSSNTRNYKLGYNQGLIDAARVITDNYKQCITQRQVDIVSLYKDPDTRGCCGNPDWKVGFLHNYCNNCGANDY